MGSRHSNRGVQVATGSRKRGAGETLMHKQLVEDGYFLSGRHLVMAPDCNATENLFGGQLLSWIDEGAALFAGCKMGTDRLVTLKMGEIIFKVPVERGRVVSVYCKTSHEGTTSLGVHVVVTKRSFEAGGETPVIDTNIVFVSVGEDGKPRPWNLPIINQE